MISFKLALATGIKSLFMFKESLNKIFNKLSNLSSCNLPFLSKITSIRMLTISSESSVRSFLAIYG